MKFDINFLSIIISVLIVLVIVATFFIVTALRKIDKITIIEERLNRALDDIVVLLGDVKLLLNRNNQLETRLDILELRLSEIQKEMDNFKKGEF